MKAAGLLFLLLCAACVQPPRRAAFQPPDGHWWLAASHQHRDGFEIGWDECDGWMLRHRGPSMSSLVFEAAITGYYQRHPRALALPVSTVIARLDTRWKKTRAYPFVMSPPANEYTGDNIWWNATAAQQDGMIRGFLACQVAEQGRRIAVPVPVLVRRVSHWYGVDPNQEGAVNPATMHDRLSTVILRAEKPTP